MAWHGIERTVSRCPFSRSPASSAACRHGPPWPACSLSFDSLRLILVRNSQAPSAGRVCGAPPSLTELRLKIPAPRHNHNLYTIYIYIYICIYTYIYIYTCVYIYIYICTYIYIYIYLYTYIYIHSQVVIRFWACPNRKAFFVNGRRLCGHR